jgi:hypothetical protein
MDQKDEVKRWGAIQRLEFIEFRTFWEGGVNRSDITTKFGVSVPQASSDLSSYQKVAPNNLRYDSSLKRYVATNQFSPVFLKLNADRYLVQLKALADKVITLDETWIETAPSSGIVPTLTRRVDPFFLKQLISVVKNSESIEIRYQSMYDKETDDLWRRVTPHGFGFDGLRWHARAYCHRDSKFRDFILSRISDIRAPGEAGPASEADNDWNSFFDVVLIANPLLTKLQREAVEIDYEMREGQVVVPVRYALLYYFEKRLRFDAGELDRLEQTPVVIKNKEEFKIARQQSE